MSSIPRGQSFNPPIWDDPSDLQDPAPPPPAPQVAPPAPPPPHAGLPDTLFQSPNATVIHGTDPGDFYCEHVFYASEAQAAAPGSAVQRNASGERLTGFLHLPDDQWTGGAGGAYTEADRHRGTREVVGAALRGYYDDLAPQVRQDPLRIMLTGFGPFESIADNPTGDFVSHQENIDASMRAAFGANLLTASGTPVPGGSDGGTTLAYRVRDPASGRTRTVQVHAEQLPVADTALDPRAARSIENAYASFRPEAVISMGVYPGSTVFRAEHHADDGGMQQSGRAYVHVPGAPERNAQPENYSLARAILRGTPSPV